MQKYLPVTDQHLTLSYLNSVSPVARTSKNEVYQMLLRFLLCFRDLKKICRHFHRFHGNQTRCFKNRSVLSICVLWRENQVYVQDSLVHFQSRTTLIRDNRNNNFNSSLILQNRTWLTFILVIGLIFRALKRLNHLKEKRRLKHQKKLMSFCVCKNVFPAFLFCKSSLNLSDLSCHPLEGGSQPTA